MPHTQHRLFPRVCVDNVVLFAACVVWCCTRLLTLNHTPTTSTTAVPKQEVNFSMSGVETLAKPLYMDMQATTPVDPRVLDAMMP